MERSEEKTAEQPTWPGWKEVSEATGGQGQALTGNPLDGGGASHLGPQKVLTGLPWWPRQ